MANADATDGSNPFASAAGSVSGVYSVAVGRPEVVVSRSRTIRL
jgi:hypothetical protein